MNIEQNLDRILQAKNNIIRALQEKNSDIPDNTLIDNIPTYVENLPTGESGGSASGELIQKYSGATVLRIVVPHENYDFCIRLCNSSTATYDIDWGDDIIEYSKEALEQHHIYSKTGVYDINIFNLSENVDFGVNITTETPGDISITTSNLFNNSNNDTWNNKCYNVKYDNICTDIILGDKIVGIVNYCFKNNYTIKNIKINSSIKKIGANTFQNCSSLETINLSSVTNIATYAFQNCYSLSTVDLSSVTTIDTYAFQNCYSLSTVDLSSITSINSYAFQNCNSLETLNLPSSLTSISNYAFQNCYSFPTLNLPSSLTSLSSYTFNTCKSLQHLVIPSNFQTIGANVFSSCYSLNTIISHALTAPKISSNSFVTNTDYTNTKRYIYIYKNATGYDSGNFKTYLLDKGWELRYIEDYEKTPTTLKLKTKDNFFNRLEVLGNAELINYELINDEYIYYFDNDIEEIGAYSFYNKVLKNIVVPEGVEVLNKCFKGATFLEEVDLPSTLTTINEYTFNSCERLHTLICRSMVAPTSANSTWNNIGIRVPSGVKKRLLIYRNATGYDSSNTYWNELFNKGFKIEYID